jgi:hypothetical protein
MSNYIHTCSSVLVRPNGITRYINTAIEYQTSQGHDVVFISDVMPTETITGTIIGANKPSGYTPNIHPTRNHVWLQFSPDLVADIVLQAQGYFANNKWDKIICHDIHSFIAMEQVVDVKRHRDIVFVQHESDVQNAPDRWSFLSDEYLALQIERIKNTDCTIAHVSPYQGPVIAQAKHLMYLPVPFTPVKPNYEVAKTRDLIYIGDSTERKNVKKFLEVVKELGIKGTVITHEPEADYADCEVLTFKLEERDAMYAVLATARVAFQASQCECLGIATLECLQYGEVVLCGDYTWTQGMQATGANVAVKPEDTIRSLLALGLPTARVRHLNGARTRLEIWCEQAQAQWDKL